MASGSQLESEWTSNLPFVLYMFFWHTRAMDDDLRPVPRREFLFDVEQALRTAAKLLAEEARAGRPRPAPARCAANRRAA